MTRETKTTIELTDIKTIEFECATCHTKLLYQIDKFTVPLMVCNVCQPAKTLIAERSSELEDIKHLVHLIQRFSSKKDSSYTMRFDISESAA